MWEHTTPGQTIQRTLASHDRQGIQALYPPEAIAVVEFERTERVFWNSRSGNRWQPEIGSGKLDLIYRDDIFRVDNVLKGDLPPAVVVRGVGGQIGDVHLDFEGQVDWQRQVPCLLFLRRDETPFDIGFERAWTVAWSASGSFVQSGDRWINADRLVSVPVDGLAEALR